MRNQRPPSLLLGLVCGLCLTVPCLVRADIAVIVHRENPVHTLTARQVSDFYLGRARNIESSELLNIYEQPVDSTLREKFFHGLNGMNLKQLNAYWARLRFSGEVLPPISLPDSLAMLNTVRRDRNAMGYVDAATLDSSVRIVLLLKE